MDQELSESAIELQNQVVGILGNWEMPDKSSFQKYFSDQGKTIGDFNQSIAYRVSLYANGADPLLGEGILTSLLNGVDDFLESANLVDSFVHTVVVMIIPEILMRLQLIEALDDAIEIDTMQVAENALMEMFDSVPDDMTIRMSREFPQSLGQAVKKVANAFKRKFK